MSTRRQSRFPLRTLLLVLMVLPPIAIFAGIPWLKQQPDSLVFLLSGIAAILTVVASFGVAILTDRQIDEWQRSAARFSGQWGWTIGAGLVALLLSFPPFRDLIVATVADWADVANPDQKLVVLAFAFGFGGVVIAQGLSTMLLSVGWALWMSRSPREPS